ncbi:hydrogenase [Skermanella stibiiresistens SB22]|uniref:Hydrogenase n=1 Tax=Skermanella stibiiresistens SB22 TaxID=1385369 RepID=W9GWG5_9PROT|nr:nickel-dependent hydrogenase large subunit [Skermanella stibiiresistens]EWY38119.1 hydrogenase [Skermanella stibiiresistens SB22]
MNARASVEGTLSIQIVVIDATVADVRLRSTRATGMERMLTGRPMDEVLALVPMLFSLCGMAQGIAAVRACESALGMFPSPRQRAARELLILAEMTASHAWQVTMDWPRLLGGQPDPAALLVARRAVAEIPPALYPARDWNRPGGGMLKPNAPALDDALDRLSGTVETLAGTGMMTFDDIGELSRWARSSRTTAARMLARVMTDDMAGFGRSGVPALPDLPDHWFAERLAADPGFSAAPSVDGRPAETGALGRTAGTRLMTSLTSLFGNGLLPRLTARVTDLAALPQRMREAAGRIAAEASDTPSPASTSSDATGSGVGTADTARGRLAHWVALRHGIVTGYRTVAPNEWNFHPRGALARGLIGLPADDDLPARVGLLIAALDPCVPCHVSVEEHAGA